MRGKFDKSRPCPVFFELAAIFFYHVLPIRVPWHDVEVPYEEFDHRLDCYSACWNVTPCEFLPVDPRTPLEVQMRECRWRARMPMVGHYLRTRLVIKPVNITFSLNPPVLLA